MTMTTDRFRAMFANTQKAQPRIDRYMLPFITPWRIGSFKVATPVTASAYRNTHIRTNVDEKGYISITSIVVEGTNQLVGPGFDASVFSAENAGKTVASFYADLRKQYNLTTDEQIDDFLDKRDWAAPDPGRMDLPTVGKGQRFIISGEIAGIPKTNPQNFSASLVGWASTT